MKKERDTQKSRVYKSDQALVAIAKPLPTVPDIERYVKWLFDMKRVRDAFPKAYLDRVPEVRDGRGRRRAAGGLTMITMPLWSRNEAIVIHELAHTVTQRTYGSHVAGHGWQYCSVYLTLTLHAMGREAHDVLKAAFRNNRVKYRAPRQRIPMDSEKKVALVARLAAYRIRQKVAA